MKRMPARPGKAWRTGRHRIPPSPAGPPPGPALAPVRVAQERDLGDGPRREGVQGGQRRRVVAARPARLLDDAAEAGEVDRLGHAWSGGDARQPFGDPAGPDASKMAWAFIARQFARG